MKKLNNKNLIKNIKILNAQYIQNLTMSQLKITKFINNKLIDILNSIYFWLVNKLYLKFNLITSWTQMLRCNEVKYCRLIIFYRSEIMLNGLLEWVVSISNVVFTAKI